MTLLICIGTIAFLSALERVVHAKLVENTTRKLASLNTLLSINIASTMIRKIL